MATTLPEPISTLTPAEPIAPVSEQAALVAPWTATGRTGCSGGSAPSRSSRKS